VALRPIARGGHDLPQGGNVTEVLQSEPQGLGSWFTVAAAAEKATESGGEPDGLAQGRRLGRRYWILVA
jgi:hypothetical protein